MAPAAGFSEVLDQFVRQHECGERPVTGRWLPGIATRPLFAFEGVPVAPSRVVPAPRRFVPVRPQALRFEPRRPSTRTLSPSQQQALDHLVALGASVSADFTATELRSAFRALARRYHPDRHPDLTDDRKAQLAAAFGAVCSHYDVLKTAA